MQRELGDNEGAREALMLLLSDGDDAEAPRRLVEDAAERGDHQERVELPPRLGALTTSGPRTRSRSRCARRSCSPRASTTSRARSSATRRSSRTSIRRTGMALHAIADLRGAARQRRGRRRRARARDPARRTADEQRRASRSALAALYEGPLDNPRGAIRALEIVHAADPEDFDAIARLLRLCERSRTGRASPRCMAIADRGRGRRGRGVAA